MYRRLKVILLSTLIGATSMLTATQYVRSEQIMQAPSNSAFKAFMDYRSITSKTSRQYKLQQWCVTNDLGFRVYNGRYTVAIGTGFDAPVGTYIDVVLSTGVTIPCIVGDIKQNIHTDSTNKQVAHNGNVVEFIVDTNVLPEYAKIRGDISVISIFGGDVESIRKYSDEEVSSIDFDSTVVDVSGATKAVVTDKYCVADMYFIEYCSDSVFNTVQVDSESYAYYTIGESIIDLP